MEKILVDTDVLIDFMRGYDERIKSLFYRIQKHETHASISLVSVTELYAGKDAEVEAKQTILTKLLAFFNIVLLDLSTAQLAGNIKRKYSLSLADSYIAATSLENGLPLLSFNNKHFKQIPELSLYQI